MNAARGEIRRAAAQGVAEGLRRHLPDGVGLLARGIPIWILATFAHFVLGVPAYVAAIGAAAASAATSRGVHRR